MAGERHIVKGQARLWDEKGLTFWPQLGREVRVVRSLEEKTQRERIAGKWVEHKIVEDWRWAVFFDRNLKAPLRLGKTRLHLARLLADDLARGGRESLWVRAP